MTRVLFVGQAPQTVDFSLDLPRRSVVEALQINSFYQFWLDF